MKAGATASLFTLRLCREFERSISGKVTLTLVCDEETFGEYGARHLLAHHPACLGDALLSGEPGPPGIIRIGDKGRVWSTVTFRAPGGHAAMPYVSKNAIHEAIRFFAEIRGIETWKSPVPVAFARYLTSVQRTLDRELGSGATAAARRYIVGLGVITGGDAVNVIAPSCTIQVDARIPMGGQVATVVAALQRAARAHGGDLKLMSTVEPSLTSAAEPICRIIKQAVEGIGGKKAVFGMGLYSDDVRLWRYAGVPAVGYGPTPHNMLRPNEYVEIRDLMQTVMVHGATALAFLERPA
jgi:succinyl-diaminopimelate desuccinylase